MNDNIFIGLVIISWAIGYMTTTPIGWLIFGSGLLVVGIVHLIRGKK